MEGIFELFEEHPVLTSTAIMIAVLVVIFCTLPRAIEPAVITSEHTFTGTLGMVTYQHGWFGIGVTGTTLSFQNNTEIATFHFDTDLPVIIGKNYTVTYEVTEKTFYNITSPSWYWYRNSTTVTAKQVILTGNQP